jgi:hypothetical protein
MKVSGRRYEKMQQMCLSVPHCPIPRPQLLPVLTYLISACNSLCLSFLSLQVLVCTKCKTGTNEDDCIETNAQSRGIVCRSGSRGGCRELWFWVSLLKDNGLSIYSKLRQEYRSPYLAFQVSDEQAFKNLACLVTVSNILESLGCVLSTNIEQNFLSTSGCKLAAALQPIPVEYNRTKEKTRVGSFPAFWHMKRGIADL